MNKFQLIIIAVFGAFIVVAVFMFAIARNSGDSQNQEVIVWGTMDEREFDTIYRSSSLASDKSVDLVYRQKNNKSYDKDFVEALASGTGPDVFFMPENSIIKYANKVFVIPYVNYPLRNFKDNFVEEAELLLADEGILGLPLSLDPIVMYWNRDILSSVGIASVPLFWADMHALSEKITIKDKDSNLKRATVSLGEFANIDNAKEIISALLLQTGNPIVVIDANKKYSSVLNDKFGYAISPIESVLTFYTDFANPAKKSYSWNRSLPNSKNFFAAGDLAFYLGFASKVGEIKKINANLNFDIALLPYVKNAGNRYTYGRMQSLAISKSSQNIAGAFKVINALSSNEAQEAITLVRLASVRRDISSKDYNDSFKAVIAKSALISRGWYDPDPEATNILFADMIESITSGRERISAISTKAQLNLQALLN